MRRFARLLALLLALGIGLALAEGGVRLAGLGPDRPLHRGDRAWDWGDLIHRSGSLDGLAYELVPDLHGELDGVPVVTNAQGLRGPPILARKGRWLRRVAVVGDSTTFGWGVSGDETYAAELGRLLAGQQDGSVYEVLNFGVSGYSTRDEALVVAGRVLPLEPDLIVLGYNLNDPEFRPRQPLQRFFSPSPWWEGSRLARWIAERIERRERRVLGDGDPFFAWHAEGSETWASVRAGLQSIGEATRAAGVPVLVAIFPVGEVPPDPADYRYAALHEQVAQAARSAGLEVLDLAPVFAAHAGEVYLLPDLHPDPRGHRIAAEALAQRIVADGMLRPDR